MPKMKTNRGAAKRFKLTASGKIKRKKAGLNHILTKKSKTLKRNMRQDGVINASDKKAIKRLIPYA
ncbi:MAG: 50S ribosomal protein L35 [Proteobacteria bacterium]|nr:50S ribosomal protein L35 [Pseudomonadota bacterium]